MKLLCAIFFLSFVTSSCAQNSCRTPNRRLGRCIDSRNCPLIVAILKMPKPYSLETIEFIRSSQCGFIDGIWPKVCCEKQSKRRIPSNATETPKLLSSTTTSRPKVLLPPTPSPPNVTSHPNLRLLEHNLCGPTTQGRIFGGNTTAVFDFPWMALIAYKIGNRTVFRCGGSLINKRYVLTAAHCVTDLPPGLILDGVRLGDHDISKERDCDEDDVGVQVVCTEKYQHFGIASSHYHPQYSTKSLQNDIALIRLNASADLRPSSVRPICLPIGSASTIRHKKVTVTGWGATQNGPRSDALLRVFVAVVSNEECAPVYKKDTVITYKQLCAGGANKMDSCLGDSGGPLQSPGTYYDGKLKYIQYGIVSFGAETCGSKGFPGVYTRLTYYMQWLLDTIKE